MTNEIVTASEDNERQKRDRAWRLAVVEIPILRCIGSVFISFGVFLNNWYLLHDPSFLLWLHITVILFIYCAVSWIALAAFYRRARFDLSLLFLLVDIAIWTVAIYDSGAEKSWLFFILFMRVADQTQTTFCRCFAFVLIGTVSYASMLALVVLLDHRPVTWSSAGAKLSFIFIGGSYIALSARASERRRRSLSNAMHRSGELIHRLEEQSVELREARGRAEEASAAKSEFLANMSHEMRTPLHGILGMLQLAIDSETSPDRIRQLQMARRSAEALLATIGDILDFSKIEARKLDLEPVYFSVRELMADTLKPLAVTAAEKDLMLALRVSDDVPDRVWGDPLRVRQVIVNLAANAIKFTHIGEIVVQVDCGRISASEIAASFTVRDTGIGIDPAKREVIFDPFAQADASHAREYGGTGLGLAIVSKLVDAMGGRITFDSEPGKGSAFRFSVPLGCDAVGTSSVPDWEGEVQRMRILVIEPNVTTREIVCDILRAHGMQPDAFSSIDEAKELSLRHAYSCIVANAPIVGAMLPIVRIVSPLAIGHQAGVTITWPVGERELIDAVGIALGLTARGALYTLERRLESDRLLHVMVVDDHPINQEFAIEALRRLGHRVTSASGGEEALELMTRRSFDVVLMDVQMPGIDGLEATRRFRATEEGVRTPIIALTAHSGPEMRKRCREAGFDAVLAKPVNQAALSEILNGLPAEVAPVDTIVDAVGGNLKLLARVRDAFLDQTPRLMQAMRQAIARRDGTALYQSAHTLKGAISNFPVPDALHAAAEVERAGKTDSFDHASELLPLLEARLRDLEHRIEAALR